MTKQLAKASEIFGGDIKELLSKNIDNIKIKEKIEEYVEAKKFTRKVAKELMKLIQKESETKSYLDELENDLKALEKELEDAKSIDELSEDVGTY